MAKIIKINKDLAKFNRKFSPARVKAARDRLGEQVVQDMEPFIPKRRGTMRQKTDYIPSRGVVETRTPYAKAQFYGKFSTRRKMTDKQRRFWFANKDELLKNKGYTTAGTGPRWDLKAKSRYGARWRQQVAKYLTSKGGG